MNKGATLFSVQYLRGLAAVFVLLSHLATKSKQVGHELLPQLHFGIVGVDLFFVISGFIMCHIYMGSRTGPHALLGFWQRRLIRILPMYWLLTLLALCVFLAAPGMVNSSGGTTSIWKSFLLIPGEEKFLIQNGWTLSFEFYFYAVFSLAFLLNNKLIGAVLSCAILLCLSLLSIIGLLPQYFLTDPIILEFAAGIGICLIYRRSSPPLPICFAAVLLGLAGLLFFEKTSEFLPASRYITAGLPAALFAFGVIGTESLMSHSRLGLLGKLGDSSYSMYLFHPFPLAVAGIFYRKSGMFALGMAAEVFYWLVVAIFILVVSHYIYQYVESPLNRRSKNLILGKS